MHNENLYVEVVHQNGYCFHAGQKDSYTLDMQTLVNSSCFYCSMYCLIGPPEWTSFGDINSTIMTFTWGLPQNDSNDGVVGNYVVDCSSQYDQWFALNVMQSPSEERSVELQGLAPYTTYSCCVFVETNLGRSPPRCLDQTTLEEGTMVYL